LSIRALVLALILNVQNLHWWNKTGKTFGAFVFGSFLRALAPVSTRHGMVGARKIAQVRIIAFIILKISLIFVLIVLVMTLIR